MNSAIIYTDGSCYPNPGGPGGWAAVIILDDMRSELSGRIPEPTTNNRAELIAAVNALNTFTAPREIHLFTDSEYLKNGATIWMPGWARKGFKNVKNSDLWRSIACHINVHRIRWHWVRGHADCAENLRCDALANNARIRKTHENQTQSQTQP